MLGAAYARANRRADAVAIRNRVDEPVAQEIVSTFDMSVLHLALGAKEQLLAWLERGYAQKDYWLAELKAWPWFDLLSDEPRYQDLLQRMKLPWCAMLAANGADAERAELGCARRLRRVRIDVDAHRDRRHPGGAVDLIERF